MLVVLQWHMHMHAQSSQNTASLSPHATPGPWVGHRLTTIKMLTGELKAAANKLAKEQAERAERERQKRAKEKALAERQRQRQAAREEAARQRRLQAAAAAAAVSACC